MSEVIIGAACFDQRHLECDDPNCACCAMHRPLRPRAAPSDQGWLEVESAYRRPPRPSWLVILGLIAAALTFYGYLAWGNPWLKVAALTWSAGAGLALVSAWLRRPRRWWTR